ncbi:MAG TPA: ATP-binding protein [Ktedonobacteraceae bacterium]|nr:ATP-binding protein [Ktedonobacteraceae bacterium]
MPSPSNSGFSLFLAWYDREIISFVSLPLGQDRGSGLAKETQKELWQRFHQVKGVPVRSGSGKGLGPGLSICQALIARHQGEVGIESTPGEGAAFWFPLLMVEWERKALPFAP